MHNATDPKGCITLGPSRTLVMAYSIGALLTYEGFCDERKLSHQFPLL